MSKVNEMGDSSKIDQKVVMGGFRGNLYQVKLLTLFFYRGLSSNYEYELGTEIDEAEKFDDLVFKYKNETDENEHYILVQAKHKMEKTDKIKITDLLTVGDVNFGLVKYYNSYRKAKNNDLFKMGIIEYVIVYTNNEFDTKTKEILEDDIEEVDLKKENMLYLCKIDEKGKFYKFKPKLLLEKLKPLIKKYLCDYYRIAERLVDFLLKKKTFLHSDDLFKNYHCLLADEVIDVSKKVFREEFINGQKTDSDELKHFRKVLIEVLKANGKDLESINKEFQFVFSNKFGKANDQIQLWPKEKIEITDQDIEEFSNKFVFLTEQPNGDNLDKMMENELRDKYFFDDHMYNTLIKEMTDWTAGKPFENSSSIKDERFISSKDAREFLTKINRKQNEVISKITTDEYTKIIKKFNMLFDDRAMKESLGKFLDSESMILNIFSEYVKLTSIKVYQTLKFIFEEKRTDIRIENFILLRLSMLFDSSIGHYAIRSFESKLFDHSLLIIECDNDISDIGENHKSFQEKIHFISQNSCNKKIVFISSENNIFSKEIRMKLNEKIRFEEKSDQINFVEDLSNDSKQFVLEKCSILFQGYEMKLNHIIRENSVSLIDGEVLTKIINEEKIQLGKKNKGLEKVNDYYISRKLVFELKVHDNIILLITGFDEIDFTTLSNNRFFEKYSVNLNISDQVNVFESDKSVYYDQICTKIENQVCLLKKHNDKIQLLRKNNKFALKSNEIKKEIEKTFESEIILLTGVPGMGKTCVFANWCEQIKENYPFL